MGSLSRRTCTAAVAVVCLVMAAGCVSVGPRTVERDRFDYGTTVAESWKQQMLLNIVKLRYMDPPIFLDVGQIVAGYTLERGGSLSAALTRGDVPDSDEVGVGGSVRFTDRPTITYTPLTGDRFLRGLMAPIQPGAMFALLQSGYAADFVLALGLESLNGLNNPVRAQGGLPAGSANFMRAIALMRELQTAGALNFRIDVNPQGEETLIFFRGRDLPPDVAAKVQELRTLLGVEERDGRYRLVYSPLPGDAGEIAVHTRSMLQVLLALSATVDVPREDLEANRASVTVRTPSDEMPFRVLSGVDAPADAYAAVLYRNRWFWIDDTDFRSKRAFAFIMFLFTLSGDAGSERLPVLTIPTG